jgi:putative NIF3 family GTP cyclohydrolase 1 type 2
MLACMSVFKPHLRHLYQANGLFGELLGVALLKRTLLICYDEGMPLAIFCASGGKAMPRTIQNVIDMIMASVPVAPLEQSVDDFKCGDPTQPVTGIVTTFTASMPVLRKAVEIRANLIITHEPTFYEHQEQTEWMGDDPILQAKRAFLAHHQLTIWRFHDYWHRYQSDGILAGMYQTLGWEAYQQPESRGLLVIPGMTLAALVATLKTHLMLNSIRVVGELQQPCERIGMLVGSVGGDRQIQAFHEGNLDVIICGETSEWQTCEYVRDAVALGYHKALVILGHANSEEEGMRYLATWLHPKVAEVPITFVAAGDPITTH